MDCVMPLCRTKPISHALVLVGCVFYLAGCVTVAEPPVMEVAPGHFPKAPRDIGEKVLFDQVEDQRWRCLEGDGDTCLSVGRGLLAERTATGALEKAYFYLHRGCLQGHGDCCFTLAEQLEGSMQRGPLKGAVLDLYGRACAAWSIQGCWRHSDLLQRQQERQDQQQERQRGRAEACALGSATACTAWARQTLVHKAQPKADARAFALVSKACGDGFPALSCRILGDCFLHGRGAPKSAADAVKSYRRGCELADSMSCYGAASHMGGNLGPADRNQKLDLLSKGCALRHDSSCIALAIELMVQPTDQDLLQASTILRQSCQRGSVVACGMMAGLQYKSGKDFGLGKTQEQNHQFAWCMHRDDLGCLNYLYVLNRQQKVYSESLLLVLLTSKQLCLEGRGQNSAALCNNLAVLYGNIGKKREAEQLARRSLLLDPEQSPEQAYDTWVNLLFQLGHESRARQLLEAKLKEHPENATLLWRQKAFGFQ